jgi:hypothetical protein
MKKLDSDGFLSEGETTGKELFAPANCVTME